MPQSGWNKEPIESLSVSPAERTSLSLVAHFWGFLRALNCKFEWRIDTECNNVYFSFFFFFAEDIDRTRGVCTDDT